MNIFIFIIIFYGVIYYLIHKGINNRNYDYYKCGYILSFIYSLISLIMKMLIILIILIDKFNDNDSFFIAFILFFLFISILIDWLLPISIKCYEKKIFNFCYINIQTFLA